MTKDEFCSLAVGDKVKVSFNGVDQEYLVSSKTDKSISLSPVGLELVIQLDEVDKWKLDAFTKKGR